MLTDETIKFIYDGVPGVPLVWVIDGDCIYDLALSQEHAAIFLEATEVLNVSDDYPDYDGMTIRFKKDGEILEDLQTSQYFGSCLLSNPQVLKLSDYPYGRYVVSPNARFEDGQFIILDRDMTGYLP